jgi:hypothetical protein
MEHRQQSKDSRNFLNQTAAHQTDEDQQTPVSV